MEQNYSFNKTTNTHELNSLKKDWLQTLTSPQDGMWEHFRESGIHWSISHSDKIIGYASIDSNNQLLQFYVSPKHKSNGEMIFKTFIKKMGIQTGIVGTNNPVFLSISLNFVKDLEVNTYLFRDTHEVIIDKKEGILEECQERDIERVVDFCHYSMGASKEWLMGYIKGLIDKREIFSLNHNDKIIGTCEVRKSVTSPEFADIGMIVSPDYRRKGYGTFLLNEAKKIATEWNKTPICSCEKNNIGSLKSIHNCGFVSMHQLLLISFN